MPKPSLTVRVDRTTHALLRELAEKSGESVTAVIDEAVRDLQRKRFWAEFNAACEATKADPVVLADLQQEDAAWQGGGKSDA